MNSDIEKYEQQKLNKLKVTNPDEYEKEIKKQKERKEIKRKQKINSRFQYGIVIGLCLINSINDGPPILYLLFGFIPTIIKKMFP
jgi:hypothetical protein